MMYSVVVGVLSSVYQALNNNDTLVLPLTSGELC